MEIIIVARMTSETFVSNRSATIPIYFLSTVLKECYASVIDEIIVAPVTIIITDPTPVPIELPIITDSGTQALRATPGFESDDCGAWKVE